MGLGTYYRTAGHTRWSQLLWRARYALERRRNARRAASGWRWPGARPPAVRDDFPDVPLFRRPSPEGADGLALLERGAFSHLNQTHELGREAPDWRLGAVTADRLWTVTLHYHAWAYDLARWAASGPRADEAAA